MVGNVFESAVSSAFRKSAPSRSLRSLLSICVREGNSIP